MYFNIDSAIFIGFLIINVSFGLYWGRGVKTIQDYALGGRRFSTGTLVSTIMASWLGGDYLFITLAQVYTTGLHYAIGCCGMAFGLLLIAYVFIPRMGEFLGTLSVAEAMGNLYGERIRIISAFAGSIAAAGFIAVQFKVFSDLFKNYVGISDQYTIFLAGIIVVLYSAFGGIRSVAFTDVIQFFTFGVLIPVLSIIIWHRYTNINGFNFINTVNNPIFDYKEFIGLSNPKFWALIWLFLLFATPGFDPTLFQRISIGNSITQVKKAFTISSLLLLLILLGMSWIAFLLFNVDNNLQPENLVHYIINNYAHIGLKGFILVGIVAMCMSNADANLNSASVILTHDFCYPLNIKFKSELILSKIIAITLGGFAIFLASLDYDLLSLVFMTQSFNSPIVSVPLIFAILGFRSTEKSVLIGMLAGFICVIIWRTFFMDITGIDSIMPGMIANTFFLFGSHYILKQEGGWVGIKDKESLNTIKYERKRKLNVILKSFTEFSFFSFFKNNAPKTELTYTSFGIFCIISTICTMYTISNIIEIKNQDSLVYLYESMLIIAVCLMTYPIWPRTFKKEIIVQVGWIIGIFYLLIFCNCFFVMLSNFNHLQFVIFTVNIVVVAILTKWKLTFSMIISGIYLATKFYKYYTGIDDFNISIGATAFIFYNLLLLGTAIIIFIRPKQQDEELAELIKADLKKREEYKQKELIKAIQHQIEFVKNLDENCIEVLKSINKQIQNLKEELKYATSTEKIISITEKIINASEKLDAGARYLSAVIHEVKDLVKITIVKVNIENLLYEIIEEYQTVYDTHSFSIAIKTKSKEIECDKELITQVIKSFIDHAIHNENTIKITLEDAILEYNLTFTNIYTKKIDAITLSITGSEGVYSQAELDSMLIPSFDVTDNKITFTNVHRIIYAHYGKFDIIKNLSKGIIYSFTIPIKIKEVRPKVMDLPNVRVDNLDKIAELIKNTEKMTMLKIAKALIKLGVDNYNITKITKLSAEELDKLAV